VLYLVMRKWCQVVCGIKLDYTVELGRRVKLEHFGGMIIGARSIGDDVVIRQNTTIGIRSRLDTNAKPRIGHRVEIGAGAVIVGDITIGNDCIVGANCVIASDLPPGSVATLGKPDIKLRRMPTPPTTSGS
jgi:serine O-acetyltransferase